MAMQQMQQVGRLALHDARYVDGKYDPLDRQLLVLSILPRKQRRIKCYGQKRRHRNPAKREGDGLACTMFGSLDVRDRAATKENQPMRQGSEVVQEIDWVGIKPNRLIDSSQVESKLTFGVHIVTMPHTSLACRTGSHGHIGVCRTRSGRDSVKHAHKKTSGEIDRA
jgi:hypothetical protein